MRSTRPSEGRCCEAHVENFVFFFFHLVFFWVGCCSCNYTLLFSNMRREGKVVANVQVVFFK